MDSVISMLLTLLLLFLEQKSAQIITANNAITNRPINDITDNLIKALGVDIDEKRFKELKQKLNKVDSYVVDKDRYIELIMNETIGRDFNATSFYEALNQPDSFQYLAEETPKSLYLKMKEKMTRDDIEEILKKHDLKNQIKSARKNMGADGSSDEGLIDEVIDDAIDKLIVKTPEDEHKFKEEDIDNTQWDPQPELKARAARVSGRRLYRGERTTVRDFPFMVAIQVMGRFWCGGVIYWRDLVLTSAACLQLMHNNRYYRENPRVLQVRIGSNHSRLGGELVDALEVYFHPSYNPRTLANNIAVIRLRRHVFMNYHRIPKMVGISHYEDGLPFTAEVLVLGWGVTRSTQKLHFEPVFLQKKFLPIYPNVFCKEAYGDKFITSNMFCAGTMSTGEGACDHDAGGPALLSGKLVGIISYGPTSCGFPNAPTVFTLVGAFADWIETVNETKPQYYTGVKSTTEMPEKIWHIATVKRTRTPKHRAKDYKKKHLIKPINQLTTPKSEIMNTESVEEITEEMTTDETTTQAPTTLWLPEVRATEDTVVIERDYKERVKGTKEGNEERKSRKRKRRF